MKEIKICDRGECNQGLANRIAYFYLLGFIPCGSWAIGCGVSTGEAYWMARMSVKRYFRWFIAIDIR